jgi:magnesium chelatase subunit I
MIKAAVLEVFKNRFSPEDLADVVHSFDSGTVVHTGDDVASGDYADLLEGHPALAAAVSELTGSADSAEMASAVELILEGLHLSKRLNKESMGARATFRGRG